MAYLEQRGQRWIVRWREGDILMSRSAIDKDDAKRIRAEIELGQLNGSYIAQEHRRQPFLDYLENVYAGDLTIRDVTRANYESVVRLHLRPRIGSLEIGELTPSNMRKLFASLSSEEGPWTAAMAFRMVRRAVRQALAEGLLPRDPLAGVKMPTPQRRQPRILTPEQVSAVAGAIDPRYRCAVLLSAWGGLSIGELGALTPDSLDLAGGRVTVSHAVSTPHGRPEIGPPKAASRRRTISVPLWLAQELREHQMAHPGPFIFSTPLGGIVTHLTLNKPWVAACKAAGLLPVPRFHDLRHTMVAILIQDGAHPKLIQSRLGHSSITMTLDTYGHLFPTADADLAAGLERFKPQEAKVIPLVHSK